MRLWVNGLKLVAGLDTHARGSPAAMLPAMPPCAANPVMQHELCAPGSNLPQRFDLSFRTLLTRPSGRNGRKNRFRELRDFRYLHRILRPELGLMVIWISDGAS